MTDESTAWAFMSSWLTLTPTTLFLFLNLVIGTIAVTSRFTSTNNRNQQHQHQGQHRLARAPSLLDRVKSIDFSLYKFPTHQYHHDQQEPPHYFHQPAEPSNLTEPDRIPHQQLARAPSLLDRVKSINFSLYKFPTPSHEPEPSTWFQQAYETNPEQQQPRGPPGPRLELELERAPSLLQRVKSIRFPSVYGSQESKTEVIAANEENETNPVHKHKRSRSGTTKQTKLKLKESMKKSVSERSMKVESSAMTEVEEAETVERRRPQTARLDRTVTVGDGDHAVDAKADDFINKFKRQLRLQRLDSLLRYKEMLQGN